jgi:hypothetical protein
MELVTIVSDPLKRIECLLIALAKKALTLDLLV